MTACCAAGRHGVGADDRTSVAVCCEPCDVAMTMPAKCQQVLTQGQFLMSVADVCSPAAMYTTNHLLY